MELTPTQIVCGLMLVGILLFCAIIWPRVWGIRSNGKTTEPELRVASLHDDEPSEEVLRDLMERHADDFRQP